MNQLHGIPKNFKQVVFLLSLYFIGFTPVNADILSAAQDAYVSGLDPNTNSGDEAMLRVTSWGPSYSFIEFDVSSLSGSAIDSATLLIDILEVKKAGTVDVRLVDSAWSENTVTFNDQPGFSNTVMSFPIATGDVGGMVSVDVTSLVQGWADGTTANYGIALTSSSINTKLGSKEGGKPATLDVTANGGPPPIGQQLLRVVVTDEGDLREGSNIAPGETTLPYWTACDFPGLDYEAHVYVLGGGGEIFEENPPGKMVLVESKPHRASNGSVNGWVVTYLNQSDTMVEDFVWRTWASCLITNIPPEPE